MMTSLSVVDSTERVGPFAVFEVPWGESSFSDGGGGGGGGGGCPR